MPDPRTTREEANRKAELAAAQRRADVREVMGLPSGRRLIWDWLSDAGLFRACFTGSSQTFYNEGRREFGLRMFQQILEACPDLYAQAVQELRARENDHAETDDGRQRTSSH